MNNPLTKEQLREKIAKVMSDWGVDFYEGNLIHREEQRLSIIRGFQDAMINIILEDRKAYAEYVIGAPSLQMFQNEQRQRNQKENK